MLNSKERSALRGIASKFDAVTQIGKNGLSENLISSLSDALDKRELVKVTVLENCALSVEEAGEKLAEALKAEFVCGIGKKIVLFRKSCREGVKHLVY